MTKILTALTFAVALGLSVATASAHGNFAHPEAFDPIPNDLSAYR